VRIGGARAGTVSGISTQTHDIVISTYLSPSAERGRTISGASDARTEQAPTLRPART
jgi:hypothetical protein